MSWNLTPCHGSGMQLAHGAMLDRLAFYTSCWLEVIHSGRLSSCILHGLTLGLFNLTCPWTCQPVSAIASDWLDKNGSEFAQLLFLFLTRFIETGRVGCKTSEERWGRVGQYNLIWQHLLPLLTFLASKYRKCNSLYECLIFYFFPNFKWGVRCLFLMKILPMIAG